MPRIAKPKPLYRSHFMKQWREHRELTQEQAAERLQIDRTTLSKIERGLVPYSQGLLEAAASAYGCEPQDLIMRDPKSPVWSILDTLKSLSPDAQRQIAVIVETFRKAS